MGKHSKEKEMGLYLKKILIVLSIVIIIIFLLIMLIVNFTEEKPTNTFNSIKNSITNEGEKLVFKSTSEYNKIVEYNFEENIPKSIKIYEQFETEEEFQEKKELYYNNSNITVLNIDEENKSIEIEKKDFGSDKELSYDQIYDKYLVQIIGAYEKI